MCLLGRKIWFSLQQFARVGTEAASAGSFQQCDFAKNGSGDTENKAVNNFLASFPSCVDYDKKRRV